ncbi:hypothetical protein R1flu_024396 [Riccia fluitans]|uniref:Ubiquitin-like protease family profile domain-containing protein n=1 Tax=Riccia fluitans TaxID=41844 RepID=A0ABD1XV92_9MARC
MTTSRLEMDPTLSTPIGQTSGRDNNHIPAGDTTKEVPPTSSKVPSDGIMEEFVSQMTTMLSKIVQHHGRANQRLASLEEDLAHTKLEEEKLKATIEALEKEKSEMNAKVALMERKDLYDLLKAKMEGFQIANHPGTIGGFKNLNLTITKNWMEIPTLNLEEFKKCPADFPEAEPQRVTRSTRVRLEYEPTILLDVAPTANLARPVTLDLTVDACEDPSSLPQSQIVLVLAFVDLTQYTSSPENEGSEDQGWPCKKDLTKAGLEFAMYKGPYLRGDVINMYINEAFLKKSREQLHKMFYVNTIWFTKASELVARYDKTNHVEEAMIKITHLWKSICPEFHDEDMQGNLLAWIFVPIHGKNHWSLAIIRIHNDDAWLAHLDSFRGTHDPKTIFHS